MLILLSYPGKEHAHATQLSSQYACFSSHKRSDVYILHELRLRMDISLFQPLQTLLMRMAIISSCQICVFIVLLT